MPSVMDLYSLKGRCRQINVSAFTEGVEDVPAMNSRGEFLMSQALPERAELVRLGHSFSAQMPAASAWTLLITIPTTLANLSLQNGETSVTGNKSYIIDRFWVKAVTSMASACALTPLSQLVLPGTALVANSTSVLTTNLSGSAQTTNAQLCMASTATGCLQDKWNHHGSAIINPTTNIAATVEVFCYGRYIVRPGGSFNINAQESVSGGTAICGVEWHEVYLPLV
jgi:hypothetical protein